MGTSSNKAFAVLSVIVLVALNTGFFACYSLWQIADNAALNRMETSARVDPSLLLPHSNLMWLVAHGTLISIIALDVLAIVFAAKAIPSRRHVEAARAKSASLSA